MKKLLVVLTLTGLAAGIAAAVDLSQNLEALYKMDGPSMGAIGNPIPNIVARGRDRDSSVYGRHLPRRNTKAVWTENSDSGDAARGWQGIAGYSDLTVWSNYDMNNTYLVRVARFSYNGPFHFYASGPDANGDFTGTPGTFNSAGQLNYYPGNNHRWRYNGIGTFPYPLLAGTTIDWFQNTSVRKSWLADWSNGFSVSLWYRNPGTRPNNWQVGAIGFMPKGFSIDLGGTQYDLNPKGFDIVGTPADENFGASEFYNNPTYGTLRMAGQHNNGSWVDVWGGGWNHVVATYEPNSLGGSDWKLYENGKLSRALYWALQAPNVNRGMNVGWMTDCLTNTSRHGGAGLYDEIAIWSRALSSADVSEMYNNSIAHLLDPNQPEWSLTDRRPLPATDPNWLALFASGCVNEDTADNAVPLKWIQTDPNRASYKVYFGTNSASLSLLATVSAATDHIVAVDGYTNVAWTGALLPLKTYYWRVDTAFDDGSPELTGPVWSFSTCAYSTLCENLLGYWTFNGEASVQVTGPPAGITSYSINRCRYLDNSVNARDLLAPMTSGTTWTGYSAYSSGLRCTPSRGWDGVSGQCIVLGGGNWDPEGGTGRWLAKINNFTYTGSYLYYVSGPTLGATGGRYTGTPVSYVSTLMKHYWGSGTNQNYRYNGPVTMSALPCDHPYLDDPDNMTWLADWSGGFSAQLWFRNPGDTVTLGIGGEQNELLMFTERSNTSYVTLAIAGNQYQTATSRSDNFIVYGHGTMSGLRLTGPINLTKCYNGAWHHALLTYEPSGSGSKWKLYGDGVLYGEYVHANALPNAARFLAMGWGYDSYNTNDKWNGRGMVDDVATWNRTLTAGEAERLYAQGLSHVIDPNKPFDFLDFRAKPATDPNFIAKMAAPCVTPGSVTLEWIRGEPNVVTHKVYFGTNSASLSLVATKSVSTDKKLEVGDGYTSYQAVSATAGNTTYYWRVDEVRETTGNWDGDTAKGVTYSFKTCCTLTKADGDVTGDCKVETADLNAICANWLTASTAQDCDSSGKVDLADLAIVAKNWLKQQP